MICGYSEVKVAKKMDEWGFTDFGDPNLFKTLKETPFKRLFTNIVVLIQIFGEKVVSFLPKVCAQEKVYFATF